MDYTPSASNALQDAAVDLVRVRTDPSIPPTYDSRYWNAINGVYPSFNEILGLIKGRVSSVGYSQTYVCVAGLNVGDPVYISSANTMTLALATTDAKERVVGFVRYKPTTTSCYIEHFRYVSGLGGLTNNTPVFLTDTGGFSATPGTIRKVLGIALSATEALLFANPIATENNAVLSVYADNTAALVGGLTAGCQYRTSTGVMMIVY